MNILSASQIRQADESTLQQEGISSAGLMERASVTFVNWFDREFSRAGPVLIFAGTGNNGGDALCIARLLDERGFHVKVFAVRYSDTPSEDFQINENRLKNRNIPLEDLKDDSILPLIPSGSIVIDGLWGSGLNRPVKGFAVGVIEHINASESMRIAIDIPSGLYADKPKEGVQVKAHLTASFQCPKLAFFFPENGEVVGEWTLLDIGLDQKFIQEQETPYVLIDHKLIHSIRHHRHKFSHKGDFGHAGLIGGSKGKMGAMVMAAKAALKSGSGLVTTYIPECGYGIMQSSFPEGMCLTGTVSDILTAINTGQEFNAVGIGPGMGTGSQTRKAFRDFLPSQKKPLVIDADALNILAKDPGWLDLLPSHSILTPHPKEFQRLTGEWENDFERLEKQQQLAADQSLIIVLKGSHTSIALPDGRVFFNNTGNPGMATGGTGDVLTGMITGLLAQSYTPLEAAILGVSLHGLAGDVAAMEVGEECLTATDVINYLPHAYNLAFD